MRSALMVSVGAWALAASSALSASAQAQTPPSGSAADNPATASSRPPETSSDQASAQNDASPAATGSNRLKEVVVVARGQGTRDARKNELQTVDAIGPRDIDSLPSQNISDVLKRLPGVQVTYDNGEAQQPNIRGLSQIQTLLDGRELVTAGQRSLQIGDVPGDIVNGVQVFKTQSANQIEGGIGGLVEIDTKQPFQYPDFGASGSLSFSDDQKSGSPQPQGAIEFGDSWNTSIGKIGVSVAAARTAIDLYSHFAISDYASTNSVFDANHNGVVGDAGDSVISPTTVFPIDIHSRHIRDSENLNLQWQPTDQIEVKGSLFHYSYDDESEQYYLLASPSSMTNAAANAGAFTTFPGTNIVSSGTYSNVPITSQSLYVNPRREDEQESLSAAWHNARFTVSGQFDFTQSDYNEDIDIFGASATASSINYVGAMSPNFSTFTVNGLNTLSPAAFGSMNYTDIEQRRRSLGNSQRVDLEYRPDWGFIHALQVGVRFTQRTSISNQGSGGGAVSGTLASYPGLAADEQPNGQFVTANPYLFENDAAFRNSVGLGSSPPVFTDAFYYQLRESTLAGYVRATYGFPLNVPLLGTVPVDGDLGVRVVQSNENGSAFATGSGTAVPVSTGGTTVDPLPSGTIRFKLTDQLQLRASGSKTLGRPSLDQLSPSLSINNGVGSSGNPNLKPFYAESGDLGLDWFFNRAGYFTIAGFTKSVQGFIANTTVTENIGGVSYQVTEPINGGSGWLNGVELNFSQKFIFLPGLLSGVGVDANYTYIASHTVSPATNRLQTLTGLSRDTWNMSIYYDKDPLLVRVGYAITSKFINNDDLGAPFNGPEIFGRQDVLDATVQYRIDKHFRLTFSLLNAIQPNVGYYNTSPLTPDNSYVTYRRYEGGIKFNF